MQQLRFLFAMALLYMFRVTISPIIRSTLLYMATGKLGHLGCYSARSTTQNNKTVITYNSTTIELLYY